MNLEGLKDMKGIFMLNDTVIEYLIKFASCVAVILQSKLVWRIVLISMATFFWKNEIRFALDKLSKWFRGYL